MIISFDIGGSAIKGGVAHSEADITPLGRRPTPKDDFAAFVDTLRAIIAETGEQPTRLAFSIAGVVDPDTQRLTCANIPCIHGRNLAADLEAIPRAAVFLLIVHHIASVMPHPPIARDVGL